VVLFLAAASGSGDMHLGKLATELAVGILIGVGVPWLALRLEKTQWFAASTAYEPLNAVAIGLLVLAVGKATHGNLFLAAFAAGITVATFGPRQRDAFTHFGELVAEVLKLAALLVFGALISVRFLADISWTGWVFAVAAIVVARPVALWLSFLRSGLSTREQLAAMWFGPKGFASVVYGLLVLEAAVPAADEVFHLVALTIVLSIVAHSSTDILVARTFDRPATGTLGWRGTLRRRHGGWQPEETNK
jgi:NhaP-type Na+/H+ or K+/H+ antiporter